MRLLFVCTGNLCRSPVAERLTLAWARQALPARRSALLCRSAGMAAPEGQEMHPYSAAALVDLGGDPTGFRSRAFLPQMAEEADLVLTMTRAQRTAVLELTPRGLRRTFTLREAADLLQRARAAGGELGPLPGRASALAQRLDAARAGRFSSPADDIADPIGGSPEVHRATAEAIAAALRPLAAVLFSGRFPPGEDGVDGVVAGVAAG